MVKYLYNTKYKCFILYFNKMKYKNILRKIRALKVIPQAKNHCIRALS